MCIYSSKFKVKEGIFYYSYYSYFYILILTMYSLITDMDFKTNTTHVVIKFNGKLNGKDCIDLIPLSWILINNGQLQC